MSKNIEDVLFKQGILFDLDVGRWSATKKLKFLDLNLPNLDPNAINLGHKKLLPKSAIKAIQELESKARSALASCSSDFPIAGARFVRYPVLDTLLEKLTELKLKFHAEVKTLLANYPDIRDKQLEVLNKQAESIAGNLRKDSMKKEELDEIDGWLTNQFVRNEQAFLDVEKLKEKFKFEWRMFQISSSDSLEGVSADQALEAQKKLQADLQSWVAETAVIMHQTLGEAAANAKALLEKQGKLNPKNLKPLFDAFEAFKSIDFAESDLQKTLDDIKKQYAYLNKENTGIDYETTASMLNDSPDAKQNLKDLLASLGKYALEDVAMEAGKETLQKVVGAGRMMNLGEE